MRKEVKEVGVLDDWEREIEARAEARGMAIGMARVSEKIARNCIKMGKIPLDEIAKACGLTLQHVQELAEGK